MSKKDKLVKVPFKYDKPASCLIQQLEKFNELYEVKVKIKNTRNYVIVTGIADGQAWHIIAWLESQGLLDGIDIQMTKGFWDRTIKHWKEHGFDKRNR